MKPEGL